MQVRGLSLLETVVALFLLVAQVLVLLGSFQRGLRHQSRSLQNVRAQQTAHNQMAEIRAWARVAANFDSDWSTYAGLRHQQGDLLIEVEAARQTLYSPCASLESAYDTRAYRLPDSLVSVKVSAIWDPSDPRSRVVLVSSIGQPARAADPHLRITQTGGDSSPVPFDGIQDYKVEAFDAAGRPLTDLRYSWQVKPLTGNATVLPGGPRDGGTARVQHVYTHLGHSLHVSGAIQVQCQARYHGRELSGSTGQVMLQ